MYKSPVMFEKAASGVWFGVFWLFLKISYFSGPTQVTLSTLSLCNVTRHYSFINNPMSLALWLRVLHKSCANSCNGHSKLRKLIYFSFTRVTSTCTYTPYHTVYTVSDLYSSLFIIMYTCPKTADRNRLVSKSGQNPIFFLLMRSVFLCIVPDK